METNYKKLFLMLLFVSTIAFSQQDVLIDFGDPGDDWVTAGNYNNMTEFTTVVASNGIADLVNSAGTSTGFGFAITSRFEHYNTAGATVPTGDAAAFDPNATKDSYFTSVNSGNSNGVITLSGLDDSKFYSFEIFAGRATTQNRETEFTITGNSVATGFLNPGGATSDGNTSNTLLLNNIQPSAGNITVGIKNGANNVSDWSYMNVLKMTESDATLAVREAILEENGLNIYPNPVGDELNIDYILNSDSISSILVYDITGRVVYNIKNGKNRSGIYSFKWNRADNNGVRLAPGTYFLKLQTEKGTFSKKLILK